ncbi:hypothetical protein OIE68_32345 [Nocardia vinacea]|uniref:Uncharacterized protein n=1 Tax=Nocardia vinacea TaxID=96468 RepID=A0ABZ1Z428_9NOCA|nr:hypothetical protein OIE68_32345 [Nocardia vinacea]
MTNEYQLHPAHSAVSGLRTDIRVNQRLAAAWSALKLSVPFDIDIDLTDIDRL